MSTKIKVGLFLLLCVLWSAVGFHVASSRAGIITPSI